MKLERKLISVLRTLGFAFSSATNGAGLTANATNLSGVQKLLVGDRGVLFGADRVSTVEILLKPLPPHWRINL